ncbi:hypothetical protein ACS0TY_026935 [Phlomoides rotata]
MALRNQLFLLNWDLKLTKIMKILKEDLSGHMERQKAPVNYEGVSSHHWFIKYVDLEVLIS